MGIGPDGEDLVVDVTVVTLGRCGGQIGREQCRAPGQAAVRAEKRKSSAVVENTGNTVAQEVAAQGMTFMPIGFDASGAPGSMWSTFIKTLSETAHMNRGHDELSYRRLWSVRVAMAVVKTGTEVAVRRYSGELGVRALAVRGVDDPCGPLQHGAAIDPFCGNDVDALMGVVS